MKKFSLILAFLSFSTIFGQKNLIKNGSFESDAMSWRGENVLTINPYVKKTGSKSGNIYEYTSPSWKGIDQEFIIPKNTPDSTSNFSEFQVPNAIKVIGT